MDFINKIFSKKIDDSVHEQFVRFGKGVYEGRAIIKLMKGKDVKVSSSFEFSKDFAELICELTSKIKVSGIIMSKEKISDLLRKNNINAISEEKKGGLFYNNNLNEQEVDAKKLKEIIGKAKYALLNIVASGVSFKCKQKLPKPGKGEAKVDDKFCILQCDLKYWNAIRMEFFSDLPELENTKKVFIKHTIEINNIITPSGINDYEQMRLMAKRKGKIIRIIDADKKESKREVEFEV